MRRLLPTTTTRQVGWIVALATISSNLLVLGVWLLLSPGSVMPGSVRAMAAEIVAVAEMLDHADEPAHAAIIATARRQGLDIARAAPPPEIGIPDNILARAVNERLADRGLAARANVVAPNGSPRRGIIVSLDNGLRVTIPEARMATVIPSLLLPPTTVILLLGVPLLLVLLWVAARITRPLGKLAEAADAIAAAGHHVTLPETGTSEIRRVAHAINALLARLREDVAERARIMAGVSHDLRTPLTRLKLRVETLPDTALREKIAADLARMEAIVGASLTLLETDLREEPVEAIDIAALASTICDTYADAGHDVAYEGPLHLVIRGQPTALERALSNLVDNACKHAGSARLVIAERPGVVDIAVEDQGPGIAETDLPQITEAYRRREQGAGSCGLGLAIVASVARAHGGGLALRNRAPRGLSAELRLPALNAA